MKRVNWSESAFPLLTVFVAAFGAILLFDLRAVTGSDRIRVVQVGADADEAAFERESSEAPAVAGDAEVAGALEIARAGDVRGARKKLQELLAVEPTRVAAWSALGGLELTAGETGAASTAFAASTKLAPGDGRLRFQLALALERSGKLDDADREYREAARLAPNLFGAKFNLGSLLLERGDAAGAVEPLQSAVPLAAAGASKSKVLARLGTARRRSGDSIQALAAYDEAILHGPTNLEARLGRCRTLLELGRLEPAAVEARAVLALNPSSATARFLLGQIAARGGNGEQARREYAEAVRLRPSSWDARYNLGRAELAAGNIAPARTLFETLRAERPDDPEVLFHLGRIAYREDRHGEAVKQYRAALEAKKGLYPEASLNLGLALRASGDRAGAEKVWRELLVKKPDYAEAMFDLGLLAMGSTEAELSVADAWFEKAAAADPKYAEAWFNRGVVASRRKKPAEAEVAYRKALAIRPDYADAHLNLAALLSRAGKYDAAIAENRAVLRSEPSNAKAFFNLGRAWSGAGKLPEAEAAYRRAIEIDSEYVSAWVNLGVVLADRGDPRGAIKVYREALDRQSSDVKLRYNLALQYRKVGDLETAEAELRRLVRLDPSYRKGWKLLAEIVEARSGADAAKLVRASAESSMLLHPEQPDPETP